MVEAVGFFSFFIAGAAILLAAGGVIKLFQWLINFFASFSGWQRAEIILYIIIASAVLGFFAIAALDFYVGVVKY